MAANTSTTTSSSGGMDKRLLQAAISGDSTSMKEMALQDPSILLGTTIAGNTCLHISTVHGHEGFCEDVLELEQSLIKVVNLDGETSLINAVRNGHISLASFLLGQHCSVLGWRQAILHQDKHGLNALHHAIRNGHKDFAMELITADPALSQAVNKRNESPMYFAVTRNFTNVYEKLMQNPLSACSGGPHGINCLHAAVTNGDQDIAKIIMEKRPELAREANKESTTPVRYAVLLGKIEMLRVMLEHDSTLGYEINGQGFCLLTDAAYRGHVAAARELLKHCPDAPPYNQADGQTLLHLAVRFDQAEFVEYVLRTPILRKVVNVQDNNGKTALHYAVQKCNPRMVVALLCHEDIDATVLDNAGNSAAWELSNIVGNAKTLNWVRM